MTKNVNIMYLDAFTYRERLADPSLVMFVPVGAIEQHGPAMPLGVDAWLSTKMAELVAEKVGGLVGPAIALGYKSQQRSGGGNHLVGSFGLDAETVINTARGVVRELHRHGARQIAFINGHYENYQFLFEGADLALRDIRAFTEDLPQIMLLSYWDFVPADVIERLYPEGFPGWDVEHGGVMETSLMMEYFPEYVHADKIVDQPAAQLPLYDLLPVDPSLTPDSGCLSSGRPASAEKGRILAGSIVEGMAGAVRERFQTSA